MYLTNILSQQEGPLGKIAPLFKVMDKVRFTEDESKQITMTQDADRVNYSFPADVPDFGKLSATLEDSEATAVLNVIEAWPKFRPADHTWVTLLMAQLS